MAHAYILELAKDEIEYLNSVIRQRTNQAQIVERAKILLYQTTGISNGDIAKRLDVNINTVKLCLNKFKESGIQRALYDDPRSGRRVEITDDAVAWMIDIACQRPADLGYSQELWTLKNLHQHIQKQAISAGYPQTRNYYKIHGTKDIKTFRDQTLQDSILL